MGYRTFTVAFILLVGVVRVQSATAQLWVEPRCKTLSFCKGTSLVDLPDGRLLTIEGAATVISRDDGRTWSPPRAIYDGPPPGIPKPESGEYCSLLRTRAGTLVLLWMDMSTYKWSWNAAKQEATADARLDVWAIRSLDEGKTWIDRQKILDGWCGALIGMIQTTKGQIVAPAMCMLDRNRHAILSCVSVDEGKTWRQGNIIDLGGRGHHDGAMEATVAELSNGRLLMFIRTNLDFFWEAYSDDGGRYWREFRPSKIDASTSPGYLIRLASGRLALLWNRRCLEGKSDAVPGGGPDFMERQATSWQRAELSLAFSQDDGKTWSTPVVVARQPGAGLSYPTVLERRPGELWVITRYPTKVSFSLKEAEFVQK
jgi:sialidase-1